MKAKNLKVYSVARGIASRAGLNTNSKPVALKLALTFAQRKPAGYTSPLLTGNKVRAYTGGHFL